VILVRFFMRAVAALLLVVVACRFIEPPVTSLMMIRAVETRSPLWERQQVPLRAVSPALLRAVIAAEDERFLAHHGVDWGALERAREYNERWNGRRLRGAGTITMQCARTVFLWPGRSYVRKGLEIGLAYVLELAWGKRRILEVYVNSVEWGDRVYGIEAAARRYFGVPAARLDAQQSAFLAAVLPNPRRWSPAAPTPYIQARAAIIEARAARVGLGGLVRAGGAAASSPSRPGSGSARKARDRAGGAHGAPRTRSTWG
jgi:monofunctional biosynthetic peptidoglycan transglycosylase